MPHSDIRISDGIAARDLATHRASGSGNEIHGSNRLLPRQRLSQTSSRKKQEQILAQIYAENLEKRGWERKETKELKPNTRRGSLGTPKSSGG